MRDPPSSEPPPPDARRLSPEACPTIPEHQLIRLIGHGGYGDVWLARHISGHWRAVKLIYRDRFEESHPFDREYAGMLRFMPVARVEEGLVKISLMGRTPKDDCFYYSMELGDDLVTGADIDPERYEPKTIQSVIEHGGRLPLREALRIGIALARALGHLHQSGLVHRDVKPSNLIFVHGQPKLADIGLVTETGDAPVEVGTDGFMAPEGAGSVPADLYSLGKVLFEMITGKDGRSFSPSFAPGELTGDRTIELELRAVLARACATRPEDRYRTAAELQADLALIESGQSVRRRRVMERWAAWLPKMAAGLTLILLLVLLGYLGARKDARTQQARAQRAAQSEQEARSQLLDLSLARARSARRSGQAGQRLEALATLRHATALARSLNRAGDTFQDLRAEAIAALTLVDAEPLRPLTHAPGDLPALSHLQAGYQVTCDAAGALQVQSLATNTASSVVLASAGTVTRLHAMSSDGQFLAVTYADRTFRIWDVRRRETVLQMPIRHTNSPVDFTRDNRQVALVPDVPTIVAVYALDTRRLVAQAAAQAPIGSLHFSPDGLRLAVVPLATNEVEILSLYPDQLPWRLRHASAVQALCWHSSGDALAVGCRDFSVYLWKPVRSASPRILVGHQAPVTDVVFHSHDATLLSAGADGVRWWDPASLRQLLLIPQAAERLQCDRDGAQILLQSGRATASLWTLHHQTAGRLVTEPRPNGVSASSASPFSVAFDPAGELLVAGSYDGARVWDAATFEPLGMVSTGTVLTVGFPGETSELVLSGFAGLARWRLAWNNRLHDFAVRGPTPLAQSRNNRQYAWSEGGDRLLCADATGVHLVRDNAAPITLSRDGDFDAVALSRDGRWAAAAMMSKPLACLWETTSRRMLRQFPLRTPARLAFSPDNRWVVTGDSESFIFWDVENGTRGVSIPRHDTGDASGAVTFSPDGKWLALALTRTKVQLRAYPSGRELAVLEAPQTPAITALAFDLSTTRLAVASANHSIYVWDLLTLRRQLAELSLDWE